LAPFNEASAGVVTQPLDCEQRRDAARRRYGQCHRPRRRVQEPKPTIILEHGAFADGSSWSAVIERLRADGCTVVAPANPLRGPAYDAAVLRSLVDHIPGPKILVGRSCGGSVISEPTTNDRQVKALVYVAAFLPAPGETALGLTDKFPRLHPPGCPEPGDL
jgi:pimeloyl-ACP methyl ester carboxylesterase